MIDRRAFMEMIVEALRSPAGQAALREAHAGCGGGDGEELLTVSEAASEREVKPAAIYKMVERGQLQAVRVGRSIRIRKSDLMGK